MKNILLMLIVMAAITLSIHSANALSIERKNSTNSDGTPKFADPDEQPPPFLVMPDTESGSSTLDPSEGPVSRPSVPDMLGATRQSEQDFDRASSHLQNQ